MGPDPMGPSGPRSNEVENIDFSKVPEMALPGVENVPTSLDTILIFLTYLEVHSGHIPQNPIKLINAITLINDFSLLSL